MTQQTAAPYTVTDLTVPYGEKIAISTNGGGIVTIWYQTGPGVSPPGFYVHDRINNEEVLLGTFAAEQVVRIDTSGSPALYDIGASPSVGSGDADTLKGYSPDATDTADTVVLRDSSGDIQANAFESTVATGTAPLTVASTTVVTNLNADALDGISSGSFLRSDAADTASSVITFSAAPVLENNISLSATETGATIRTVLSIDGSDIFQIGSANNTTNIRSSGTVNVPSGNMVLDNNRTYQIKDSGGTARVAAYIDGSNNLYLGNSTTTTIIQSASDFSFSSNLVLSNNRAYQIQDSGSTPRVAVYMDGSNNMYIGDSNAASTRIQSAGTVYFPSAGTLIDNNRFHSASDTGAATRSLIGIDGSDITQLANTALPTNIQSNGTLTYNGASLATGSIDTTATQTITVVDGLITSIA